MTTVPKARFWRIPLDAGRVLPARGTLRIDEERCKGCGYCVEFCPRHVLALSRRYNRKGYHPPDARDDGTCAACRLCEVLCPEFAIAVSERTTAEGTHER